MNTVIFAVVVLAVLGAIFGLVLAIAAKVFAVEVDPREEAILGCLPGANCGGCGFPGCSGYAAAVVKGTAPVNACAAGGDAVAAQIGEIMGVAAGESVKKIAQVHCTGCGQNYKKYEYVGLHDCVAASLLPGGVIWAAPTAAWVWAPVRRPVPSTLSTSSTGGQGGRGQVQGL